MVRYMTAEEAWEFRKERCSFIEYKNIREYIEDIVVILMHTSWHYSEKEARERCEERMIFIENSYNEGVPADDCAIDVGYSCG